jgi:hypothetical protein
MRFGTWNVRSLYRSGSLTTVASRLAKNKLNLVGVHKVRWDKLGFKSGGLYFFYGKGDENHQLGTGLFVRHKTVSAVKKN